MSIKSNGGDTSTGPKILTGTLTFAYPGTWSANSINYEIGDAYGPYNWIDVSFEGLTPNGFKATPVITATIKGTTMLQLVPRIAVSSAYAANQGFKIALYNTSGSSISLSSGASVVVNWIAIENTNKAF
jgi:hypothetical protein